jgi:hypothetical protein
MNCNIFLPRSLQHWCGFSVAVPLLNGLLQGRAKATADPSTTLRFAQDDSFVVMQSNGPDQ